MCSDFCALALKTKQDKFFQLASIDRVSVEWRTFANFGSLTDEICWMEQLSVSDWGDFCKSLALGDLVPEEFAEYRPVIIECAVVVLRGLSPLRAMAILADQLALGGDSTVGDRIIVLARHCPALHKLAQLVSRDRRLPIELRRSLQHLESMPTAVSIDELRDRIEDELGPLDRLDVHLDGDPLAEASVAVVTPFIWRRGDKEKRGVFKILKSGIEARLEEDLALLTEIALHLDKTCETHGLPAIDYESTFQLVRDLLRLEIDLTREQENMTRAAVAYAGFPSVHIPELFPFCTSTITAMERLDGYRVTDGRLIDPSGHPGLAMLVTEALLARPLWSSSDMAMFHADPHAGNLLLTPDNRLGILDWSLVGSLSKAVRVSVTQILTSALALDAPRIKDAVRTLSSTPVDEDVLSELVTQGLADVRNGAWPGVTWMQNLLESAQAKAGARFGAELLLFWKVLHVLRGVLADIDEDVRLDGVLARSFLSRLGVELGGRAFMPPYSRALRTHLSNLDLAHLVFSAPAVATRYWWRFYEAALFRALKDPEPERS
jgi:ubiquinone biosynthesis protein